jgi:hypothetical protein
MLRRTASALSLLAAATAVPERGGARGTGVLGFAAGGSHAILGHSSSQGALAPGVAGVLNQRRACASGHPQHAFADIRKGGGEARCRNVAQMSMSSGSAIAGKGVNPATEGVSKALAPKSWLQIVWEFSRPHTIIGSVLSVISLHVFAASAPGAVINLTALGVALAWAIFCAVLINIYVTGLNQVFDVEIDKINKPYLPIAAGYLSLPAAWGICLGALLLGTVPSMIAYPFDKLPLLSVTLGSVLLGTGRDSQKKLTFSPI